MSEPHIRYVSARDGANLAYWAEGAGPLLILLPPMPWSHLQFEWQSPRMKEWFERFISAFRTVRYDNRGSGLSDRDVKDYSLDAHVADVEALLDRLGTERAVICGLSYSSPVAIALAARHPERVSHLVLWCGFASAADVRIQPLAMLQTLVEQDWALFTETVAHALVAGWDAPDEARHFAALMREAIDPTPSGGAQFFSQFETIDVTDLLARIEAPTLVLQRRGAKLPDASVARRLAAAIPGAQLVLLEGDAVLPWVGNTGLVHDAVEEFVGVTARDSSPAVERAEPAAGTLRTILFTDIEGHTGMMQRLGDAEGRIILREHERITREALREFGGNEVKTMGDGFMASFGSAQKALECAVALQRRLSEAAARLPFVLRIRVGLNAGEPIAEEDDLFGSSVIAAARIAAQAQGGEILVSNVVRELAAGKGFLFSDRGETVLRGFDDPVRLFELRWQEA